MPVLRRSVKTGGRRCAWRCHQNRVSEPKSRVLELTVRLARLRQPLAVTARRLEISERREPPPTHFVETPRSRRVGPTAAYSPRQSPGPGRVVAPYVVRAQTCARPPQPVSPARTDAARARPQAVPGGGSAPLRRSPAHRLRCGPARRGAMNASHASDDEDDYECPSVIHASGKPGYTIKYDQEASASRRSAPVWRTR